MGLVTGGSLASAPGPHRPSAAQRQPGEALRPVLDGRSIDTRNSESRNDDSADLAGSHVPCVGPEVVTVDEGHVVVAESTAASGFRVAAAPALASPRSG